MNRYKQGWFGESYRHHLAAKGFVTNRYYARRIPEKTILRPIKEHTLLREPAVSDVFPVGAGRAGFIPLPVGGGEEELIEQEVPEEFREERKLLLQDIAELDALRDIPSFPHVTIDEGDVKGEFQPAEILQINEDGTFHLRTFDGNIHRISRDAVVDMVTPPAFMLRRDFENLKSQVQSQLNDPKNFNNYLEGKISEKFNVELMSKPELISLLDKAKTDHFILQTVTAAQQQQNALKAKKRKLTSRLADIEKRGVAVDHRALRSSDEVFFQRIPLGELRAWLASETNRPLDDFEKWNRSEVVGKVLELPQRKKLRQEYTKHMEESGEYFPGFVLGFKKQLDVDRPAALDRQRATQERAEQRERVFRMPETLSPEERKAVDAFEHRTKIKLVGRQPVESFDGRIKPEEIYVDPMEAKKAQDKVDKYIASLGRRKVVRATPRLRSVPQRDDSLPTESVLSDFEEMQDRIRRGMD